MFFWVCLINLINMIKVRFKFKLLFHLWPGKGTVGYGDVIKVKC